MNEIQTLPHFNFRLKKQQPAKIVFNYHNAVENGCKAAFEFILKSGILF